MNDVRHWLSELDVSQLAWIELLAKTTLVLAIAWLFEACLARANPRWRRLLWRTTGCGLILVAASPLFPPLVSWAILPAPIQAAMQTREAGEASDAAVRASIDRSPPIHPQAAAARKSRSFDFSPQSAWIRDSQTHTAPSRSQPMGAASGDLRASSSSTSRAKIGPVQPDVNWRSSLNSWQRAGLPVWVAATWCAGVILILVQTVLGVRRLTQIRNRATAAPDWVVRQTAATVEQLGCRQVPDVLVSDEIASPFVTGVRRPVILLPQSQCDPRHGHELPAILAHEIAHLRGHDVAWQLLLHAVAMMWWIHPLAWRLRVAHASACDAVSDAVAASHVGDVAAYGRTLARLAIRVRPSTAATGMAMARTSSVRRRIEALHRRVFPFGLSRGPAVCAVLVGLSMFVLLGVFALSRAQAEPAQSDVETKNTQAASVRADKPDTKSGEKSIMDVKVLDETDQPVEDVALRFTGRLNGVRFARALRTDENGVARLELSAKPKIQYLRMQSRKPGLAPVYYSWSGENRAVELPKIVEVRLAPGYPINGIVRDEQGQPVEGADVRVYAPVTWPDVANYVFDFANLKTDAQGRWDWADAPLELSEASLRVTHPDYRREYGRFDNRKCLVVLKQGLVVSGQVTDADGKPIQDALVRAGFDRFGSDDPKSNTDEDGGFTLVNCKPGPSLVTVQANGYAPQLQTLTVGSSNDELHFMLEPGHVVRVRVIDVRGEPLHGVTVVTDTWRGYRSLELRAKTDAEGRVEWRSAPPDAVLCDILKAGCMNIRRAPIKAGNEETVITLPDELVISGKVTDAATGEPIPKFGVREGMVFQNSERVHWSRDQATDFTDGEYQFVFDEPKRAHLLEFVADGYLPAQSRRFKSTDGKQTFDVQLQPGSGPAGVVLTPEGKPAAGAEIAVAAQQTSAYVQAGRFYRGQAAPVFRADEAGRFTLAPQDGRAFLLVALHDSGYAEVGSGAFAESKQIQLKPWGRIDGRVMIGRRPDTDRDVSYSPKSDSTLVWYDYKTKTDADGRFRFDRVVPGPGYVARVVVTEFIGSWQNTPSWQVPVEVPPDGSVSVMIGGTGRPVVGRVVLDREPDVRIDWTSNAPVQILLHEDAPGNLGETTSYFRCSANIEKSGRFRIPDVPAGNYRLRLDVNNPPTPNACGAGDAIGRAALEFVVPPMTDNRSDEPLDLGTITAVLSDTLDPGEVAPGFVLERLSGGTVRLGELRGKLVLLDFWATWCGPCLAEMPLMKEIHEQFAENPRFAMISLACDQSPDPPRQYVEENALNWTHAFAGARGGGIGGIAGKYTVRSLPGTFLIGPDGRVLAKNVRGEKLRQAIAAALENEELFAAVKNLGPPVRFPVVRFKTQQDKAHPVEPPAVLVMDDRDPSFDKDKPQQDALRAYSASGTELWAVGELKNCQNVSGAAHVAVDRARGRIYAVEPVANRVTALDFKGRKLWQAAAIEADAVALDPKTGYLWLSGGPSLNQGATVVLDPEGNEVATYPFRGIDLAYDPHDEVIWLAGYDILQLERDGRARIRVPAKGWCFASVAVDPTDGSAWLGERKHPDMVDSHNRLWHVAADGQVTKKVELGDFTPFQIARNPANGELWVCGYPREIRRFAADGGTKQTLAIEANSVAFGHRDSSPWATTEKELLKLDGDGDVLGRYPFEQPSMHRWLTAF